jgi:hypothetical protein
MELKILGYICANIFIEILFIFTIYFVYRCEIPFAKYFGFGCLIYSLLLRFLFGTQLILDYYEIYSYFLFIIILHIICLSFLILSILDYIKIYILTIKKKIENIIDNYSKKIYPITLNNPFSQPDMIIKIIEYIPKNKLIHLRKVNHIWYYSINTYFNNKDFIPVICKQCKYRIYGYDTTYNSIYINDNYKVIHKNKIKYCNCYKICLYCMLKDKLDYIMNSSGFIDIFIIPFFLCIINFYEIKLLFAILKNIQSLLYLEYIWCLIFWSGHMNVILCMKYIQVL